MIAKELNVKELNILVWVASEEKQDVVLVRFLPPGLIDKEMRKEMQERNEFIGFILQNNERVIFSGPPEKAQAFAERIGIEEVVSVEKSNLKALAGKNQELYQFVGELLEISEASNQIPWPWERKVQASPKL